ncbi:unnamed protein product [Boreogadus saida]
MCGGEGQRFGPIRRGWRPYSPCSPASYQRSTEGPYWGNLPLDWGTTPMGTGYWTKRVWRTQQEPGPVRDKAEPGGIGHVETGGPGTNQRDQTS